MVAAACGTTLMRFLRKQITLPAHMTNPQLQTCSSLARSSLRVHVQERVFACVTLIAYESPSMPSSAASEASLSRTRDPR